MSIDIYEPWSSEIEILNFNQKYLSINEPVEMYWYVKHYDVNSVAFCDDSSTKSLEMFLTICDDLKLKPIYGVKFKVKTIEDTALDIVETICYAKNSKGIDALKMLCSLVNGGVLRAEDLWENSDDLLIGLDFSFDHSMIDIAENLLEYFLVPDFVFVGATVFYSSLWDRVFEMLINKQVLICAKENSCKNENLYSNMMQPMIEHFWFLEDYTDRAVVYNPRIFLSKIEPYDE
ncbi:MAG: hypothetical protein IJO20_08530 [Ruminococcus sp.]|nr:hypothetical protein [Ruminococcus sp.]